ncbi:MAG TPA: GNAT family N-acetyltransferase [Verrucomicrobiae bacterium]|nr:GNAT family N-acetyltransferase [Verrucomicrobiae bacterium]
MSAAQDGEGVHLRDATVADEPFLFDLYAAVRAPEFALLPEAQRQHLIRMQYAAQTGAYRAMYPGTGYQIILRGSEPMGRIWITELPGEFRLVDIALLPEGRNRGVGSALLRDLQGRAQAEGKRISSSVFRFNPGSLRWHQKLGFRVVSEDEIRIDLEWLPDAA